MYEAVFSQYGNPLRRKARVGRILDRLIQARSRLIAQGSAYVTTSGQVTPMHTLRDSNLLRLEYKTKHDQAGFTTESRPRPNLGIVPLSYAGFHRITPIHIHKWSGIGAEMRPGSQPGIRVKSRLKYEILSRN